MSVSSSRNGEKALRIVAVTALYATAIVFAVAFSPANGFVQPEKLSQITGLGQSTSLKRPE